MWSKVVNESEVLSLENIAWVLEVHCDWILVGNQSFLSGFHPQKF